MRPNNTLFIILIIQLLFQLVVYKSGFPGASGDDFFRALLSYEWRESPFFVSNSFGITTSIWFPTHFWIGGAMYMLTNNLILSLTAISVIFSILELTLLYHLTRLVFNKESSILAVILVGFLPWQVWLGISMTEMTLYFTTILSAFLFFVKWQKQDRQLFLLLSAFFFLLATMIRPEGWIFAGMFSGYLLFLFIRRKVRRENYTTVTLAMIIPSLFILFWFAYNFSEFGSPFYFLQANKENVKFFLDLTDIQIYIKSLQYLFLIFIISPVIFLLAVIGFVGFVFTFVRCNKLQKGYLLVILVQLALITIVNLSGPGTLAAPQRYAFINVILLAPFVAYLLNQILKKQYGRHIVAVILLVHLGASITKSFYYPVIYKDTAKVGAYLKNAFTEGQILKTENICSELAFRMISSQPLYSKKESLIITSSHAALEAYSGKPRNFLFNILNISEKEMLVLPSPHEENTSKYTSVSSDKIKKELARKNVKKIILQDRKLMNKVPPNFHFEQMIGTHAIFSQNTITKVPYVDQDDTFKRINKEFTEDVVLKGYKYEGAVMEHAISLLWAIDNHSSADQKFIIKMQFTSLQNPKIQFERSVIPIFHWYKIHNAENRLSIKDTIPLFLPEGMSAGEYAIKILLVSNDMIEPVTDTQYEKGIALPPVTLYSTKRDVLISFIKDSDKNWTLLAKTLLLL